MMTAEEWLKAESSIERKILEASPDLVFVKDRESRLVWANPAFVRCMGAPLEELLGKLTVPPGAVQPESYTADDRSIFAGERRIERSEVPLVRADGSRGWVNTVKTPICDEEGRVVLVLGVARDITDEKRLRDSLDRITECLLRFGPDSLENISRLTRLCGEILGSDGALYSRLGKGVLSAVGQWNLPADFNPVIPVEGSLCDAALSSPDRAVVLRGLKESAFARTDARVRDHGFRSWIGRAVRAGDRTLGVLCAAFTRDVVPDAAMERVVGLLAAAVAVEEERLSGEKARLRLSEELRQAQKMEAIGRLAGGIAHDFNNTLTAIKGYSELLHGALTDAAQKSDAGEILRSVEYASSLTRQLLAFGRRQMLVPRPFDLNELLSGTTGMLKRLIRENVRLDVRLAPGRTAVFADPGQIEQVVLNLAINARDAMPDGGVLTLSVGEASAAEVLDAANGEPALGSWVKLSVSDTGSGISPEILPHIFEPFFTTKEHGKGTGLGLATVHGIVAQSGGRVICRSVPGKGTTFTVLLPRRGSESVEPVRQAPGDFKGEGRILLVEDDPTIRGMFVRALGVAGYEVSAAPDAETALASIEKGEAAPDVLVTDVVMPGLNGHQLATRLSKRLPGLKVLYMSGYTDDAAFRSALKPGTAFLQKPFNPSDLCRKLKEILKRPA